MSAVVVGGARKSFDGVVVLDDVDLDVADGETVVLLGPSGCGKTTLLRLIAGLDRVDGGSIALGGVVMSGPGVHVEPERRGVGLVFQDGALFPHLTVTRNLGFGLPRDQRRGGPRVDELADLVGLAGLGDRSPAELSGGQQQRVALARALGPEPAVLLLDEPFSNLDAVLRERLRHQVGEIVAAAGTTSLFVTHDRAEAFALADRVALMRDGRIVQVGEPAGVYDRPVDRWAAELLGDVVAVVGESADGDGGTVRTPLGPVATMDGAASGRVEVLTRPERVRLGAGGDGRVASVQAEGATWSAEVVPASGGSPVRARGLGSCPWRAGDGVSIALDGPVWAVPRTDPAPRTSVLEGHG